MVSNKFGIRNHGTIKKFLGMDIEYSATGEITFTGQKEMIETVANRFNILAEK